MSILPSRYPATTPVANEWYFTDNGVLRYLRLQSQVDQLQQDRTILLDCVRQLNKRVDELERKQKTSYAKYA